jgi:hypothetical protein
MSMTPDPSRDIVVYHFPAVDALSGDAIGDRWSIWIGRESYGAFDREGDALGEARALAEETGRPAWLIQTTGEAVSLSR